MAKVLGEITEHFKVKMPEIIKKIEIQDGEFCKAGECVSIKGKGISIEYVCYVELDNGQEE